MKRTQTISLLFGTVLVLATVSLAAWQDLDSGKIKNPKVNYAPASKVKIYPYPAIAWQGADFYGNNGVSPEMREILERVIYPVINTYKEPIASISIQNQGEQNLYITVITTDGSFVGSQILRDQNKRINQDEYKKLVTGQK